MNYSMQICPQCRQAYFMLLSLNTDFCPIKTTDQRFFPEFCNRTCKISGTFFSPGFGIGGMGTLNRVLLYVFVVGAVFSRSRVSHSDDVNNSATPECDRINRWLFTKRREALQRRCSNKQDF